MSETVTPLRLLPCGCRFGEVGDALVFEACDLGLDCEYVIYLLEESMRQGKPVDLLEQVELG